MSLSILLNPASTFFAGILVALGALFLLLNSCAAPNRSGERVAFYRTSMEKAGAHGLEQEGPAAKAAIERFTAFLQGIGDPDYVRANTSKVYSSDAYLDDTLAVHKGAAEIEAYFINTSKIMTSYHVTVDDVASSGKDYYVRWTMKFSAPALSGGKPVTSVGVSQIRFNQEGKVAFHQDFWDSGQNFYAHLPLVGGAVGYIGKRLQSN